MALMALHTHARARVRWQCKQQAAPVTSLPMRGIARRAVPAETGAAPQLDMQAKLEFLKEDLMHLFDDKGIDASAYDDKVDFRDPITKYSDAQGYLFNISMLKNVFTPKFELHDIKVTGPTEVTTRWTMTMDFILSKRTPLGKVWSPVIIFTGTSMYGFNPANGRINRHVDTWDSITNQDFFSVEGFLDFFKQLLAFYTTPDLETPTYSVLRRSRDYQVRQYKPYIVAETIMDAVGRLNPTTLQQNKQLEVNPAGPGMKAFNSLAGYIFGGNQRREKMAMTTPVFTTSSGAMQFMIGPGSHKDVSTLPAPAAGGIRTQQEPGGIYAVRAFPGTASEEDSKAQEQQLRRALHRDGLAAELGWTLARYNDPSVKPPFRRNEVLIKLKEFDLWQ